MSTSNPTEPTLTCSEVVERLRQCVATFRHPSGEQDLTYATFDTEKAAAILHSWREHRVQETPEMYDGFWYFECGCGTETLDAKHISCPFHNKPIRQHEFKGIGKSQAVKYDKS